MNECHYHADYCEACSACRYFEIRTAARHLLHDLDSGSGHTETRNALAALAWRAGDRPQAPSLSSSDGRSK